MSFIILRREHDAIVALYERQAEEMKRERDFYREIALARHPVADVNQAVLDPSLTPLARPVVAAAATPTPPPPIDAGWTPDDRMLFASWAKQNIPNGVNATEEWIRQFGDTSPLAALAV